ncbi:MAG: hypothetical protein IKU10_02365, partial [Clostridia bacterium]|nr:hypothetical protein [Clostridia bacterium]
QTQHDSLQTATRDQQTFIVKVTIVNDEHGDWERREYIGYVDGKFVVQITLDRHFEKNMYRVNGEYVSKEEYNEQLNEWEPGKTVELSKDNIDQLKRETEETKGELEEKEAASKNKVTTTDIEVSDDSSSTDDRFGEVVTDGTSVYYWKYNSESFEEAALEGSYSNVFVGTNQLVRNTNGTETVIAEANGSGSLAIANGRIFYNIVYDVSGGPIGSCRLDGSDPTTHADTNTFGMVGVTDDNQWVIFQGRGGLFSLSTSDYSVNQLAKGSYLISYENKIYYQPWDSSEASYRGKCILNVINPDGTGDKILYSTLGDQYRDDLPYEFRHPYVQDRFFYAACTMTYSARKATKYDGYSARIVKVNLETGQGEIVAGQEEDVSEYFVVDEAGNVLYEAYDSAKRCLCMNEPRIVGNEVMIYNAQKQQKETIITAADHATLTGKFINSGLDAYEYNIAFYFVKIIGNKVYYTIHTGTHNPEGDDGMFTSYRRDTSALFEKDLTTGKVTELNRF